MEGKCYDNPPKPKGHVICLIEVIKLKILDLWKGSMSLADVGEHYGKNKVSMDRTALNSES
jgi:hypothetical protein